MNFLAHMYLSCSDEHLVVGNFVADFVNNKEVVALEPSFRKGVTLHRVIDSFTDKHPAVSQANKLFHNKHHKYAPVVTDILFDLVLSRNWNDFSGEPLDDFMHQCYKTLIKYQYLYPSRLHQRMTRMIHGQFLHRYIDIEGQQWTFEQMDKRTRYKANFGLVLQDLDSYYPQLETYFMDFFPDLIAEVEHYCDC